jgi:YidC/Oxa1 family membrane protein insertase
MEQIRFLLAIALSFLVLLVWQYYFIEKPPKQTGELTKNEASEIPDALKQSGDQEKMLLSDTNQLPKLPEIKTSEESSGKPAKQIIVQTPLFEVKMSERGASISSITLYKYKTSLSEESTFMNVVNLEKTGTALISFKNNVIPDLDKVIYNAQISQSLIQVTTPKDIRFVYRLPQGIQIVKTYFFDPTSYMIGLTVIIENPTGFPIGDQLQLSLRRYSSPDAGGYIFEGPAILLNGNLEEISKDDIEDSGIFSGKVSWAAIEDRYFANAVVPIDSQENIQTHIWLDKDIIQMDIQLPHANIAPQKQQLYNFSLFFGPKSLELLNGLENDLNEIINFGWFDIIARPCLYLMNLIYQFIPNYGIAIILLTILIKILFWPLGNKSYQSMNQMRKLQPKMKEIQEKFKNDRQKMNQELMNLYRVYKVNPLGGCLPMVLQIPVFIALYRMLYQAIELRHAPFFLWINDLSAPDRLFQFEGYIPLMQEPYGIPVLTIIMGATMFIQQKMSPPPGDPSQAKMMMFLPIFFTFIFINFPAGLVLYWLVNNVASILQQYYINKKNE